MDKWNYKATGQDVMRRTQDHFYDILAKAELPEPNDEWSLHKSKLRNILQKELACNL